MTGERIAVLLLVGLAAATDLKSRRIPNLLTFGGAAAALTYHSLIGGWHGLAQSAGGWALGIGLFLPMFLLRGMGAGDVKLLGAVGAWLGPMGVLWSALFGVLAGGVIGLLVGARHGYLGKAFQNLWALVSFWRVAGIKPLPGLTVEDTPGPRLAYGVAIALGALTTVILAKG